jgi:hypothetical protein
MSESQKVQALERLVRELQGKLASLEARVAALEGA